MQALHLFLQMLRIVAIQTIGDQQHNSPLPHDTARPQLVEALQTVPDARTSLPVLRFGPGRGQRRIHIALRHVAGDIRQPGAKGKRMHLGPARAFLIRHRMQKMKHQPAVLAHRTGDIAQDHQIWPTRTGLFQSDPVHLSPLPHRGPQGARRINAPPARTGLRATRQNGFHRQP